MTTHLQILGDTERNLARSSAPEIDAAAQLLLAPTPGVHMALVGALMKRGITQFLDIGLSQPRRALTHDVACKVSDRPSDVYRTVYVDYRPELGERVADLPGVAFVRADPRWPNTMLRVAGRTLDLTRPVGLLLCGVLEHLSRHSVDRAITDLTAPLVPGSLVAITHYGGPETHPSGRVGLIVDLPIQYRSGYGITKLITDNGLWVLPPGLVATHQWHPGDSASQLAAIAAIAAPPID